MTKCKYCRSPTCVVADYRDDPRVTRMCRHNVQLERDILENRLARLTVRRPGQAADQSERIARLEAVVAAADAVIVSNLAAEKCDEYDAAREALRELDGKSISRHTRM